MCAFARVGVGLLCHVAGRTGARARVCVCVYDEATCGCAAVFKCRVGVVLYRIECRMKAACAHAHHIHTCTYTPVHVL